MKPKLPLGFILTVLALSHAATISQSNAADEKSGKCVMFAARNIAKGSGNFYIYCTISNEKLKIEKGDVLEYDVYLSPDNPLPVGGVDFATDRGSLRDSSAVDQNGIRAHGNFKVKEAVGKW